jgi:hypothetical protein
MYGYVVAYDAHPYHGSYLYGDETRIHGKDWQFHIAGVEKGNLRHWEKGNKPRKYNYFDLNRLDGDNPDVTSQQTEQDGAGIWQSWQAIRKANIALDNIDLMVNATQLEKDLIRGQALFFRAFFHQELMKFWGRIPYIDEVWKGDNSYTNFVRPQSYAESAKRVNEDLRKAAELVPESWDALLTEVENNPSLIRTLKLSSLSNNYIRINKSIVYAYQGKNWLWAASPLMQETTNTYGYNQAYCDSAAAAFAKVIDLDMRDVNNLSLADSANYYKVFYSTAEDIKDIVPGTRPEAHEYIFSAQAGSRNRTKLADNFALQRPGRVHISPTHSFVKQTFGMANGKSFAESGDPNDPWINRDPRFYMWIIKDGDQITIKPDGGEYKQYAELYNDGAHRDYFGSASNGGLSGTGYAAKKFHQLGYNRHDNQPAPLPMVLLMRLTDVYLMYAEAMCMSSYGPGASPSWNTSGGVITMSALDALNKIRDRYETLPKVDVSYPGITGDPEKFMDVVRRERSTELCFEAHRWMDIRRWSVAHLMEYREKTALDFKRGSDGKPTEMTERVLATTVCEFPKHFWLPFPQKDTQLYEGFEQNPGW